MNRNGLSMIEMLAGVVILSMIMLYAYKLSSPIMTFFERGRLRQQMNSEARSALSTMMLSLQSAKAASVNFCSCNNNACTVTAGATPCSVAASIPTPPPKSQVVFQSRDGTWHAFWWENNSLIMRDGSASTSTNFTFTGRRILANHVSWVRFDSDSNDAAIIYVTLRIDTPLDATASADKTSSIELSQEIQMVSNP